MFYEYRVCREPSPYYSLLPCKLGFQRVQDDEGLVTAGPGTRTGTSHDVLVVAQVLADHLA